MIPGTHGYSNDWKNLIKSVIEYNYPHGSILDGDININDERNFLWDGSTINYGNYMPIDDFLYLKYGDRCSEIGYYYKIYYNKVLIAVAIFYNCETKSTEEIPVYRNGNTYFSLIKLIDIKQPGLNEEEIEDIISLLK